MSTYLTSVVRYIVFDVYRARILGLDRRFTVCAPHYGTALYTSVTSA